MKHNLFLIVSLTFLVSIQLQAQENINISEDAKRDIEKIGNILQDRVDKKRNQGKQTSDNVGTFRGNERDGSFGGISESLKSSAGQFSEGFEVNDSWGAASRRESMEYNRRNIADQVRKQKDFENKNDRQKQETMHSLSGKYMGIASLNKKNTRNYFLGFNDSNVDYSAAEQKVVEYAEQEINRWDKIDNLNPIVKLIKELSSKNMLTKNVIEHISRYIDETKEFHKFQTRGVLNSFREFIKQLKSLKQNEAIDENSLNEYLRNMEKSSYNQIRKRVR